MRFSTFKSRTGSIRWEIYKDNTEEFYDALLVQEPSKSPITVSSISLYVSLKFLISTHSVFFFYQLLHFVVTFITTVVSNIQQ